VLLLLTIVTGVVDAASYLRLGHVFVANMTGNVVFLGFGIAGAGGVSFWDALIALAAFLLAGLAGGRLGVRFGADRRRLLAVAATVQVVGVAAAAVVAAAGEDPFAGLRRHVVVALLAFAMGVQNATVLRLAVPALTTTVLTMTLTGIAADSKLAGGTHSMVGRRTLAIAAMLAGALVGALLALDVGTAAALAGATALLAVAAAIMYSLSRPGRRGVRSATSASR
jgi:uncharacterized membrane protein YoaK (UPF0700 family)